MKEYFKNSKENFGVDQDDIPELLFEEEDPDEFVNLIETMEDAELLVAEMYNVELLLLEEDEK